MRDHPDPNLRFAGFASGLSARAERAGAGVAILLGLMLGGFALAAAPAARADDVLLFAYFVRNGADGLHLAWSADGRAWTPLFGGRTVLAPGPGREKLMRDPCLLLGPDGVFRLVWTTGWWEHGIGYAASPDLVHWSAPSELPVMAGEPAARNCWAPEVVWDDRSGDYVIFWATTIPGRFPASEGTSEDKLNHRLYRTTTRDFLTFTPTRLFLDPGFSCIDATLLRTDAGWRIFVKDETRLPEPHKFLLQAAADSPLGPFGKFGPPLSPAGVWAEGPTVVHFGGEFLLYFDAYIAKHYGLLRSTDLVHWEDQTAQLKLPGAGTPDRVRHGTVLVVPRAVIDRLTAPAPMSPKNP